MTLFAQLDLSIDEKPETGGWGPGFANNAHWDPERDRTWRCWAQDGPTWSAHCGAVVNADDPLGLCQLHRRQLFEEC